MFSQAGVSLRAKVTSKVGAAVAILLPLIHKVVTIYMTLTGYILMVIMEDCQPQISELRWHEEVEGAIN